MNVVCAQWVTDRSRKIRRCSKNMHMLSRVKDGSFALEEIESQTTLLSSTTCSGIYLLVGLYTRGGIPRLFRDTLTSVFRSDR